MNVVAMKNKDAGAERTPHRDVLAELHGRRRDLISQMNDLQAIINKVANAPKDEDAVRAEIAGLDSNEREAARQWAEQGASGEPPSVDMATRVALNDKLAGAVAKTAAATAAIGALNGKLNSLGQQVNVLNQPIAITANNIMMDRLVSDIDVAKGLIAKLTPLISSIESRRVVIVTENHRISENGGGHGAHDLFLRLEGIPSERDLFLVTDPNKHNNFVAMAELEALKLGETP